MSNAIIAVRGEHRASSRSDVVGFDRLRTFIVILVILHHCVIPYAFYSNFDYEHYLRSSGPVVDTHRWIGFDLYLLFTDTFFMSIMFLLSGLFVWQSLQRRGAMDFLRVRLLRLGVPYVVGLLVLMPPTSYPSWLMAGGGTGLLQYWWDTAVTGPRPTGPLWFIGALLMFDVAAAAMHRIWPDWSRLPAEWVARHSARPAVVFSALLGLSILAYVPLLLRFGPSRWLVVATVLIQASRVLLYAVHFGAGIVIGRAGSGLLSSEGMLARGWRNWVLAGALSFAVLVGWNVVKRGGGTGLPFAVDGVIDGVVFALACCAIGFAFLAFFLQSEKRRAHWLDGLAGCSYGWFLFHYFPMVWLQYALVPVDLPAILKAALVAAGTFAVTWGVVDLLRRSRAIRAVI